MWLSFWLNNAHFALEFFGAVILFSLAWLAFDAFLIKREFRILARSIGFLLFAFWVVVHALNITDDLILLVAVGCFLLGLLLILLNLFLERTPARPKFGLVFILPAVASIFWQIHIAATVLLFLVAVLALKRYRQELLKALRPFWIGFLLLTVASFLAIFNARGEFQESGWILEHAFRMLGFIFLAFWGWQYLKVRIKESLLLIFIGMALLISVIVTFTFSAILLQNIENEAEANLVSNVKVLDYSILRMKNESLSNAQIFSKDGQIRDALVNKNFVVLKDISQALMLEKNMDFLTVTDERGEVLLRAHSVTAKGDSITEEKAGGQALAGKAYVDIESTPAEKFSIRGAAPVYNAEGGIVGTVITGFIVDNAFADKIKKATALEATVYKEDTVQATTIFDPVGKTRNVGAKQTDAKVIKQVLEEGEGLTLRTMIFSRPYLAAYLPLKNTEGEIIGMLQASRLQTGIAETANTTNRLTLLITVIITIIMLMPAYLVVRKITEEV